MRVGSDEWKISWVQRDWGGYITSMNVPSVFTAVGTAEKLPSTRITISSMLDAKRISWEGPWFE